MVQISPNGDVNPALLIGNLDDLPSFVSITPEAQIYWAVLATGNVLADHARGRVLAREALAHARRNRNHAVIALALANIAERPIDDLSAAFIDRIAAAAAVGSMN